jgi:hypothetical protein
MKTVETLIPWMTRQVNRRAFLNKSTSAAFGVFAAAAIGMPRGGKERILVSCSACAGSDDHCCNYYSSVFCNGSSCNTSGYNWKCEYHFDGCSSGSYCWSYGGHQCCDCFCSWCSPCNSAKCICY